MLFTVRRRRAGFCGNRGSVASAAVCKVAQWGERMSRCLLGVLVVTAGLMALASAARETRSLQENPAPVGGNRLRETETVTLSGASRTLLRPAPAFDLRFSIN